MHSPRAATEAALHKPQENSALRAERRPGLSQCVQEPAAGPLQTLTSLTTYNDLVLATSATHSNL